MKILRFNTLYLTLVCCLFITSAPSHAKPVKEIFPSWYHMDIDGHKVKTPYVSNHSIDIKNSEINRIVILIHGAGRGKATHERVEGKAKELGVNKHIMIFEPQFLIKEDIATYKLPNDVLFWPNGWRGGDKSHKGTKDHPRTARISSYELVNQVVRKLVANNPNAKKVVIAGQSAGGQFAQRFAAGSTLEQELAAKGISVRYLTSNPSSYLYFNKKRRVDGTLDKFAEPSKETQEACSDFNEYQYGMDDLNNFMNKVGAKQILKQFPLREVYYLQSADDNDTKSKQLANSCKANLQGSQRLERVVTFYHYIRDFFGANVHNNHSLAIVPGYGHGSKVFLSDCGSKILFDIGDCSFMVPTQLTASLKGKKSVSLKWIDNAKGETGYKVERSTDGGKTYQEIASLGSNKNTFVDKKVDTSLKLHYRVRVYTDDSVNGFSNIARVNL